MIRLVRVCPVLALALSLLLSAPAAWAFGLLTHGEITAAAFDRSKGAEVLRSLGVDPDKPLNGGFLRGSNPPVDWLVKGARDEDDTLSTNFARYRNHFYDPVNNRGLDATGPLGLPIRGQPAPDWALEDRKELLTQNFSYRDAREVFLTALTAAFPSDREAALARTFEILGHALHLVQDMAAPPHTRNDIHGGFGFGPSSLYEHHLNQAQALSRLNFNGAPVRFGLPREYWTTGDGRGLAEFVNRNFVSEGTNFLARADGAIGGGYPSPVLHLGVDEQGRPFEATLDIQTQLEPGLQDRNGNLIEGSVTFFANNFGDPITGQPLRNERMTSLSLFDRELERRGESLVFTLNRYNVEAQAAFLIPRAVGYSAGLLDYFFRGRLQASFSPGPNGGREVILGTQNVTGERIGPGTLRLFYDTDSGERRLVRELPVPEPGDTSELPALQFDVPAGPLSQYVLVYRGKLGQEKDAVVARVLSEFPIVAVQELAALTGAKSERLNPFLGSGGGRELRKDPNHQRAAGYFWAGGTVEVGSKIREVRLEEGTEGSAFLGHFLPKAVLRINGKDVGTHWQAADDPSLIPERWEVILTPIPGQTSEIGVVPPSAIWVNDFRTPLLWVNSVESATGQFTFLGQDGVPVWITTKTQFTIFHFGDGVRGSDPKSGTPLTPARTGVSFRPVGEAAGGPVPRAELAFLPESCGTNGPLYRFAFAFASRSLNFLIFPSACGVVSPAGWTKHLLWLQERVLTLGAQPDPAPPPLLTVATFRREFLDADLERFLSVGMVPPAYDIQILSEGGAILGL